MGDPLSYRGHEAADVPLVQIDRDGKRVRVVVHYPPASRTRVRNRCLITTGIAIASALMIWPGIASANGFILALAWLFGSLAFPSIVASLIFGMIWWRSGLTCVLEADGRQLCLETLGRFRKRRQCWPRERIRAIDIEPDFHGRATALVIRTTHKELGGRHFEYLDERYIREIVDAVREGLGMHST
jgi:hypothetical protein